jgi:acetamidase/formamidase
MDIKQLQVCKTTLFPCLVKGCLSSLAVVHFAQGDVEVSGAAIELVATA